MSDPAGATPVVAPPALPDVAAPLLPLPAARAAPLVGAFLIDLALAVVILLVASTASGLVWGVWRVIAVARSQGEAADAAAIGAAIGNPGVLAQMLMVIVGMSAVALSLYFLRQPAVAIERAQSFAALRRRSTWGWSVFAGLAVFVGSSLLGWLMKQAGIEPVPTNEAMVVEASERWPLFLVLFAVVLAPLYEELLFRRVLFGRFLRAGRPWLGLVLSSVAFAMFHEVPFLSANPPLAVLQLWLIYGGMGAAFAWVYWRTGSLWAAILAHAVNNGVALAVHGLG